MIYEINIWEGKKKMRIKYETFNSNSETFNENYYRWWNKHLKTKETNWGQSEIKLNEVNDRKIFGVTYQDLNNPFYIELNDGMRTIVDRHEGQLISLDAALDLENQIRQIERLIEFGVDAIFLAPVDWIEIRPALEKAREAGVPVFNVDTPVFDDDLVESIIASDNYDAGVQDANEMMKRVDSARIAILERPIVKSARDRVQGFLDTIAGKDEYEIVTRETTRGLIADAVPVMEKILQEHPEINVVFAIDDPTALGALQALEAAGRSEDVLLFSIDGSPDAKLAVKRGEMAATVAQSPFSIGTTAVEEAYRFLEGKPIDRFVLVPVEIITEDNVDIYGVTGWQTFT